MPPWVSLNNPETLLGTDDTLLSKKGNIPILMDLYYRPLITFVTWKPIFKFAVKYPEHQVATLRACIYIYVISMKGI